MDIKTIVSIPTMPSRVDCLIKAVNSLVNQVDEVHIYFNHYNEVDEFLEFNSFEKVYLHPNDNDYGSIGRFQIKNEEGIDENDFVAFCDDDLIYPPDYISTMKKAWEKYNGIITIHGRLLHKNTFLNGYSKENFKAVYPCLETQHSDCQVHICGTGAMFSKVKDSPYLIDFEFRNYDDVEFAMLAKMRKLQIMCIAHNENWLKYLNPKGMTIWDETSKTGHQILVNLINNSELYND